MVNIAVIFTCYNRKRSSINCIKELQKQSLANNVEIEFYICDDNSTDGTVESIKKIAPHAKIYVSEGNLFWCRGMYQAMLMAVQKKHDYYLMINDDTLFEEDALSKMLESIRIVDEPCGIVGSMKAIDESTITYGGQNFVKKIKLGKSQFVLPSEKPKECDIANWNCFLLPQTIIDDVGLVDPKYEHGLGDFDYSLMMRKKGFRIYTAIGYIGRVNRNSVDGTYMDKKLSIKERICKLFSRKGRPYKSEFYFYHKHYGLLGVFYCVYMYIRLFVDIIIKK